MKRYTVTAALPYANGPVHIGHLAGCYLPADIYVRYLKALGKDVLFICGSDEHGVAITIKAKKEGLTPQQLVDKYHLLMQEAFKGLGIEFSYYGRTTSPTHHETAAAFFKTLYDKGVFQEITTEQYYDEAAQQFLADRYIQGTCPKCGNPDAYGDQCERCGSSLNPTDLIQPRSTLSGAQPVLRETTNWFLPMGDIQQSAEFQQYIQRLDNWKPNIKGQCMSWLQEGLQPRSMTRDLDWGIPVPLEQAKGKVLYVWFDAPIGYISNTKEYFAQQGQPEGWKPYWFDPETSLIHFIGKDNIVFHSIIFPMILLQHGEYILPTNVPANEFLNLEGDKISTSRNWAVWLHEYLAEMPGREDELRYVLCSIAPETKDSEFTWKDYQTRVNSELVAILGNFVNRVIVLSHKYINGTVPSMELPATGAQALEEARKAIAEMEQALSEYRFRDGLSAFMQVARIGNKYLAEEEPWKKIKTEPELVPGILLSALQLCTYLAVAAEPFLPFTANKLRQILKLEHKDWSLLKETQPLPGGKQLGEAQHLFRQVEDAEIDAQIAKLQKPVMENTATAVQATLSPAKAAIDYEDFAKMDIRVATVLEAERVAGTDKLMKLTLDTGLDTRTVVSGIAHCFSPEEVKGRQVCLLANLKPRKLKGIESQGMILMADKGDGLEFVSPANLVNPGSTVA